MEPRHCVMVPSLQSACQSCLNRQTVVGAWCSSAGSWRSDILLSHPVLPRNHLPTRRTQLCTETILHHHPAGIKDLNSVLTWLTGLLHLSGWCSEQRGNVFCSSLLLWICSLSFPQPLGLRWLQHKHVICVQSRSSGLHLAQRGAERRNEPFVGQQQFKHLLE